jgi:peptide/nickel transport system substrate-binding protein
MMDIGVDSNERRAVDFALRIAGCRSAAAPRRSISARAGHAIRGLCAALLAAAAVTTAAAEPRHAIAMHGQPALPEDFTAFRYVNPDAPKGGRLVRGVLGTFDSLNPFIVKGLAPPELRGAVYESLLVRGYDEPFTLYGLLARTVDTDDERSYVTFDLDPRATFADGKSVTAADVIFSWELLRDHGRPNYRIYYTKVARATALGERTVRFDIAADGDRELRRNPTYWGRDLAVNRGFWNFDELRFDFFRDANSHLEAFKKGLYDLRDETDPGRWETAYDFPAVHDGRVIKEAFPSGLPKPMLAFVFNTRRPVFADVRVREAITLLFDFEWLNKNFFYGLYRRTASFFEGSELAARGRPADAAERALLAPFPGAVRPDVLDGTYEPPATDGSGRDRKTLALALALLQDVGYELSGAVLRSRFDGHPFTFEIMVTTKDQERLSLAFAQSLKRAGIDARIRMVDAVQFDQRRISFDFDMIQNRWDESLSPGNEQAFYWGSASADEQGSRNYMGMRSPAADAMIAALLRAHERGEFVSAVRALDRVLMSGTYVIPLFHLPAQWMARWAAVKHPQTTSLSGYLPETWWREPAK